MPDIMQANYSHMKSYIARSNFSFTECTEISCMRIDVQHGMAKCVVKVYITGKILLQGGDSKLKEALEQAKTAIENEEDIGEVLPFEIERFPELLKERIPTVDPLIVRFVQEAIATIKAGANLGCAFLLGAASERAILILVDTYTKAIPDLKMRDQFEARTSGKYISRLFEEFKKSWKSSRNRPAGYGWSNDIEVRIEQVFQFCRIVRNEAGHPHLPPNLDKGVLLANMGQFVKYVEDLYELIRYYSDNQVQF